MTTKYASPAKKVRSMEALVADGLDLYAWFLTLSPQEREAMQAPTRNRDGIGITQWWAMTRACQSVQIAGAHVIVPTVPSWLDADSGKPSRFSKFTNWQHYCHKVGEGQALKERKAFLAGYHDACGTWWCGDCLLSARLIILGADLDPPFPDLSQWVTLREGETGQGQDQWMQFAARGGAVRVSQLVETIQHLTEKVKQSPQGKTRGKQSTYEQEEKTTHGQSRYESR